MAPTFEHGKGTRVLIGAYDLSEYFTDSTITATLDPAETTTYQKNDRTFIPGLGDVTASFDGLYASHAVGASTVLASSSLDAQLAAWLGGSTKRPVTVGLDGDAVAAHAALLYSDLISYDVGSPVDGVVTTALDVQGSDGYAGGIWLRPQSVATTTGSNTAVLCPGTTAVGGTTGGGVAHFHLVAASTLTTITAKVQHSTSGSTWADLATFTSTAQGFQRTAVTGTVKEQLRSTISAYTGGAGKSVTLAVAFARRGKING